MNREGILLIGGTGFLGTAIAKTLASNGRKVHVLARRAIPGLRNGVHYYSSAQDEPATVMALLKKCSTVVHLAVTSTPASPAASFLSEVEESLEPCARLFELMAPIPPARMLFVSSGGSIYGSPQQLPVSEQQLPSPISYHAAGKLSLEAFFTTFAISADISLAILRPSNIYGPHQPLRTGFGLVRTVLEKARMGESVAIRGDGSAVRDYLYIEDFVDACIRLIDMPKAVGTYNVGTGYGVCVSDLIRLCSEVAGFDIPVSYQAAPGTDVRGIVLDSSRLASVAGWVPSWPLTEGLRETWEWLRNI